MSYTTTNLPFIQTSITSYAEYVLDSSNNYQVTLTYPSQFEPNTIMTAIIEIDSPIDIGTNTLKVTLPNNVNASRGYNARIINIGNHQVSIYQNTGNLLVNVNAGQYVDVYLAKEIWKYTSSSGYVPSDVTANDLVGPGLTLYPYLIGSNTRLATNAPVLEINESIYYLEQQNRAFTLINKLPESTFYVDINFDIGYYFSIYNESSSNCYVQDSNSLQVPFVVPPKQCITFKKIRDNEEEPILEKRWLLEYNSGQVAPPKFLLIDVKDQFNQVILPDSIFTANILDIVNNQSNNLNLLIPDPFIGGWAIINNASSTFQLTISLQNNPTQSILLPYGVATEIISDGQKLYAIDQQITSLEKGALLVGNDQNVPSQLNAPNNFSFLISDNNRNTRFSDTPQLTPEIIEHNEYYPVINSYVKEASLDSNIVPHDLLGYFDCTQLESGVGFDMQAVKDAGYTGIIWGYGTLNIDCQFVGEEIVTTTTIGFISLDPENPTAEYDLCMSRMQEAKEAGITKHILSFGGHYNTFTVTLKDAAFYPKKAVNSQAILDYLTLNGFTGFNFDYEDAITQREISQLIKVVRDINDYIAFNEIKNVNINYTQHLSSPAQQGFPVGSNTTNITFNNAMTIYATTPNDYTAYFKLFNFLPQQDSKYITSPYNSDPNYTNWSYLIDTQLYYGGVGGIMLPVCAVASQQGIPLQVSSDAGAISPYYPYYNGNGTPTNALDSCGTVLTSEQVLKDGYNSVYGEVKPFFELFKDIKHTKEFKGITAWSINMDFRPDLYPENPSWSGEFPQESVGKFGQLCSQFLHTNISGNSVLGSPIIKQDLITYKRDQLINMQFSLKIVLPSFPYVYPENINCELSLGISYLKTFDINQMVFSTVLQENFLDYLILQDGKYVFNLTNQTINFDTASPILEACTVWIYFNLNPDQASITNGEIDFNWTNFTDVQLYNVNFFSVLEPQILKKNSLFKAGLNETIEIIQPPNELAFFTSDTNGNVGWTSLSDIKYNVIHDLDVGTYVNNGNVIVNNYNPSLFEKPLAFFILNQYPENYLSEILFDLFLETATTTTENKNCNLYFGISAYNTLMPSFNYNELLYKELLIKNILKENSVTINQKFSLVDINPDIKEPCVIWLYIAVDDEQKSLPNYTLNINFNTQKNVFAELLVYSTILYVPNINLKRGSIIYVNNNKNIAQAKIGLNELVLGIGTNEIGTVSASSDTKAILVTENNKPLWQSKGINNPYIDQLNVVDILKLNGFVADTTPILPFFNNQFVPMITSTQRKISVFFPVFNAYKPFNFYVPENANNNNFIRIKGIVPKKIWKVARFKFSKDQFIYFYFGIGMCNLSAFSVDKNTGWNSNETKALGRITADINKTPFYFVPFSDDLCLDGTYDDSGQEPQQNLNFDVSFKASPEFDIPWEEDRALFFCFYPVKKGKSWDNDTIWSCSKVDQGSYQFFVDSIKYYPYTEATEVDLFSKGALWSIDEESKLYPVLGGQEGDIITKINGFPTWTNIEFLKQKIKNEILQEINLKVKK